MIYLDSAATTLQKPPAVARAVSSAVGRLATPGRGGHVPAMRAAETAFLCRQAAAELFQVESPEQVVFTSNATHGLNLAIHSLLKPGDAVVASVSEETGSISVAVGGMLKRHLAPETLERLLRNELLPERENDEAASKFKLGNLLRFGKGKKQDGNENS